MSSKLIEKLWNGFVLLEGQRVQQRLGATGAAQDAWRTVPMSQNPQAKAAQLAATPNGITSKQIMLGVGALVVVVGLVAVVAK